MNILDIRGKLNIVVSINEVAASFPSDKGILDVNSPTAAAEILDAMRESGRFFCRRRGGRARIVSVFWTSRLVEPVDLFLSEFINTKFVLVKPKRRSHVVVATKVPRKLLAAIRRGAITLSPESECLL
jgi:hypothetical protein